MADNPQEHTLSEQLTALYRSDPQFRQLIDQAGTGAFRTVRENPALYQYLAQRGIQVPERFDFRKMSGGGQDFIMATQEPDKRTSWIAPAAMVVGAPLGAHFLSGLGGGAPAAGAGGGTAAAGAASSMPGWLETVLKVAPVGAGLVSQLAGGGFGGGDAGAAGQMSPEMTELLKLSMQRMRDQEPLFQAVSKQAYEGLPAYAKGK